MEKWKEIKGYEHQYLVSNKGNVKNKNRGTELSLIKHHTGYIKVNLYRDNKSRQFSVHRLVAEAFINNKENKPCVNHKDGNKENNNVSNLEWVTRSENAIHAHNNGLWEPPKCKGENQGQSKLTESEVIEIRKLAKTDKTNVEIGKMFGVAPNTVSQIKHRNRWAHI